MRGRCSLRSLAAAAFLLAIESATSLHIPDGPIGLPDNIQLRMEHNHRRRHRDDPPKVASAMPPAHLNEEVTKDMQQLPQELNVMRDEVKREQLQRIHLNLQDVPLRTLFQILPQFIQYLPSNLMSAQRYITDAASALLSMGLQSILGSQVFAGVLCTPTSNEAEMTICVTETVTKISRLINTGSNILALNFRVLSGGRTAMDALVRLNTLAANPLNKDLMKILGCTAVLYITLMRESVPDDTKVLAGSIMTQITSLPVVSNVPDTASGGFGRVNVVLPRPTRVQRADYDIAKLRAGANQWDLLSTVQ